MKQPKETEKEEREEWKERDRINKRAEVEPIEEEQEVIEAAEAAVSLMASDTERELDILEAEVEQTPARTGKPTAFNLQKKLMNERVPFLAYFPQLFRRISKEHRNYGYYGKALSDKHIYILKAITIQI